MDPALRCDLTDIQRSLVAERGVCVIGLETTLGPVAIPGWWDPTAETVAVDRQAVARMRVDLTGGCSVTLDQSNDPRPSAKVGVMLRGDVVLLGDRVRADRGPAASDSIVLGIRTRRITAWDGFESETRLAS